MKRFSLRQQKIIFIIDQSEHCATGLEISQKLDISVRTIQNEIASVNKILPLIKSSNKGYCIDKHEAKKLKMIVSQESNLSHIILKKLIFVRQKYQIDELADILFMSTPTLEKNLKDLAPILLRHNLSLKRERAYIWIQGSEFNKRKLMNELILQEVDTYFQSNIESIYNTYFQDMDIRRIRTMILNAVHKYHFFVEKSYQSNLLINISIALYRMRLNSYIEPRTENYFSEDKEEYKIAQEICSQYARHYHIAPKKSDIEYIAALLYGQTKPILTNHQEITSSHIITQDFVTEIYHIVKDILDYYMIAFDNTEFAYNFALHIDALIKRAEFDQNIHNDLLDGLKKNSPFIYDIAVMIADKIAHRYKIKISDEEIGYISIHIGFLIEDSLHEKQSLHVLLISNDYHAITESLSHKILDKFSEYLELSSLDTYDENPHINTDFDLIITTKALNTIGIKEVIISPFYTKEDHIVLDKAITACLEAKETESMSLLFSKFFNPKLFFITNEFKDKESVIQFLGTQIIENDLADQDFIDSVKRREEISSTCFFDTFAIPHAIELNAKKTMICVLISPEGILWDDTRIHIVLMIAVQQNDRKQFMNIYNGIIRSLWNKKKVKQLLEVKDFNTFIHLLKE